METKLGQVVAKAAVPPQIPVFPSEVPSAVIPGGPQCLWAVISGCASIWKSAAAPISLGLY